MSKKLLFATGNANKVEEIRALLKDSDYEITTMGEIGFHEDIPETGSTLEQNAIIKARYLFEKTGKDVIAEDTGLEVDELDGAPGVHTARYAGERRDPTENMDLLLKNLDEKSNRGARFHTVIALIQAGQIQTFDGIIEGRIALEKSGKGGFGYDPIFIPEGYETTFSEMEMKAKSSMSHRGRALSKLINFLNK